MIHPFEWLRGINDALPTANDYAVFGVKLVITLLLLVMGWALLNVRTTEFDDHEEIVERRNGNFMLVRVGAFFGQLVATLALIKVLPHGDTKGDLLWLVGGGLVIIGLFDCLRALLQRLLVNRGLKAAAEKAKADGKTTEATAGYRTKKRQIANALRNTTWADAIMQTAFYLAYGLVIAGSFTGSAPNIETAILSTLLFLGIGLATLVSVYFMVGRRYGLRSAVYEGNVAAALVLGAIVLGVGFVLQTAIAGDFTSFPAGVVGFAVYAVVGITTMLVLLPVLDKAFLGKYSVKKMIKDKNWQAAGVLAAAMVGTNMILSSIPI